jgi:hypothetical protein
MNQRELLEILSNRPMWTRKDLARRYGRTLRTIDRWRSEQFPKPIFYHGFLWRPSEIIAWEQRHRITPERPGG